MNAERALAARPGGAAWWRRSLAQLLGWIDERPGQALGLIVLLAVGLGVAKLWIDRPSFEYNWENRWWQIALHVARGQGYVACKPLYFPFCDDANQATAMREPLPVLLFALVARLTNESLLAAAATGLVANLGVLVAIFLLGRELASPRAGVLAALLWAGYLAPIRLFYSQVSGDLLATLGLTCGVVFLLRARQTEAAWLWVAAGLALGLATLSRSAVAAIVATLALGLLWRPYWLARPRPGIDRLRPATLLVLAWAVTLAPWLARNYVVFGQPVIGSTMSGYYLFRQNHTLPSDHYLRFVSGGEFKTVVDALAAERSDLRGTENEAEMDAVYREEALRVISRYPARYAALSAYRALMLWFHWGVNDVYGRPYALGDGVIAVQHALLLGLGVLGLRGRWRRAWPLAMSIGALSLVYMAVMAHLPYIVPVVPLLTSLSALPMAELIARHAGPIIDTPEHAADA